MADFDGIQKNVSARADEVTDRAKAFVDENRDKIEDALKSDRAEDVSDKIIHGLADGIKKVTGGKFDEQIDKAAQNLDDKIGNNGTIDA
ncbi:CHASE3 domain sensor protein [Curtobacterium pusillum]|uniref:CHASE3 domain sensor protein n=1 Tax=Curtobacterium pusillum TaxID=69373 RepID=A0AAW3T2J3_9MICO|nr:Rv0909 family putative TA system antitoxin [Curtobacterium pusillum]MBA8989116.1 CHASE3 domain sensor protein [Curtobacterium pusillum]